MAINIQPYHKKGYLCLDDGIACAADYFEKTHIFMHTKGFNFNYAPRIVQGAEVLKRIRTSCYYPTVRMKDFAAELDYLQDFVGLKVDFISGLAKPELINFITASIQKKIPVALISNTYDVPWYAPYYQKVDKLHSFLVIDVDSDQEYLLCIDGYLADGPVKMPFENVLPYTDILSFTSVQPRRELSLQNIILQITESLADNQKLNHCNGIRLFADDVIDITFSESEKKHYCDLDYSDFMVGLKSIEFGRKNFGDFIGYLAARFIDYQESLLKIQSDIEHITQQWRLVIIFFVKSFYAEQASDYMKKAGNQLLEIADKEEEVTRSIQALLQQ